MNLNLVHIDTVGTNLHEHLVTVTSGVGTVSGGQTKGIGSPLLEERVVCEVGSVTSGCEDDRAIYGDFLVVEGVCDTSNIVSLLVDLGDLGLLDE